MAVRATLLMSLVGCVCAATTVEVSVTDCCKGADPPCKGSIATLDYPKEAITPGEIKATGQGTLEVSTNAPEMELSIKMGGAKILDKTVSACGEMKIPLPLGLGSVDVTAITCPAPAGDVTVNIDIAAKIALPSATKSHSVTKDENGNTLLCLDIDIIPKKDEYEEAFDHFVMRFGKSYADDAERAVRFELWKANYIFINTENAKGTNTYELGVNSFTDLSRDEFAAQMFGFKAPSETTTLAVHEYRGEALASSIDWRASGAVTPVKNQGQCGSCWSFSTTGALEGAWKISQGALVSLSEEEFVQCDTGSNGCGGGSMQQAFGWAKTQSLCTESSYPYTSGGGKGGSCHKSGCSVGIPQGGVAGYKSVARSEQAMMSALNQQPVSIAVEADKSVFQSYKSGIMSGMCGTNLDHGILAVGYGTDAGKDYWLVKNSWGTVWGEQGFGRLLRGKNSAGECGILMQASYPQVSGARATINV